MGGKEYNTRYEGVETSLEKCVTGDKLVTPDLKEYVFLCRHPLINGVYLLEEIPSLKVVKLRSLEFYTVKNERDGLLVEQMVLESAILRLEEVKKELYG